MLCRWRPFGRSLAPVSLLIRHSAACGATPRALCFHTITRLRTLIQPAELWSDDRHHLRRKDIAPIDDTIYALSTGPGKAAIAVIRVSGPACLDIYGGLCPDRPFPQPRKATLRKLSDPEDHDRVLDAAVVVLHFPAPRTVTGEDILELHVHGGPATVRAVLEAIPRCSDARPRRRAREYGRIRMAEPGEFTKRAFYNGRIELTQAEALGTTLAAETEQQRRLAVAGSGNALTERYEGWRQQLLYARGELEALIDFSEDQHFDESFEEFTKSVNDQVHALQKQIALHMHNAGRGELLRDGINVVLLGAPNAGKSSLLNTIVGREAAIVSGEAGTTRDIVDVSIDMGGWLVRLGDMAGLRSSRIARLQNAIDVGRSDSTGESPQMGIVEKEGIRRARERALQADVVIAVVSLQRSACGAIDLDLNPEVADAVRECQASGKAVLVVVNKSDLLPASGADETQARLQSSLVSALSLAASAHVFFVSCKVARLAQLGDAQQQHGTPMSPGPDPDPDPGNLQRFLHGLKAAFAEMTSAVAGEETVSWAEQDAQAYWNASLAVTHRQKTHLQQCLVHLEDYLAQHYSSSRSNADQSTIRPGPRGKLSHFVDDHRDLVGEVVKEIDTHQINCGRGLTHESDVASAGADTEDHPPLSADGSLGAGGCRLYGSEPEFDIVNAAEHLRYAADCLAKITGRGSGADVESVLGVVFEK